jgi:hypothetical protein
MVSERQTYALKHIFFFSLSQKCAIGEGPRRLASIRLRPLVQCSVILVTLRLLDDMLLSGIGFFAIAGSNPMKPIR